MGLQLYDQFPEARRVFDAADRALGFPISKLCFEGPEEELRLTENTQPAILTVSVAAYRVLEARSLKPDYVAGHSLGEYAAVVAAGVISLEDAVVTVRRRGRYMQEAVPVGTGAMAAILGLDEAALAQVCSEAANDEVVSPANFNSSNQIVIAGNAAAVERAMQLAKDRGARRAIPLTVSAPFHCALMRAAQERLRLDLERLRFSEPAFGLVNNVDALLTTNAAAIRDGLVRQVSSPVRWKQSMDSLRQIGVEVFVEIGPGKVLTGLLRNTPGPVRTYNVEDPGSLENVCRELRGAASESTN